VYHPDSLSPKAGLNMPSAIAKVLVFKQADQPLDYLVPESFRENLSIGMRVWVPIREHRAVGLVVGFSEQSEVPRPKPILEVIDTAPIIDGSLLELTRWLSDEYITPWGSAIRTVLPEGLEIAPRFLYRLTDPGRQALEMESGRSLPKTQRLILRALAGSSSGGRNGLTAKTLARRVQVTSPAKNLRVLMEKGWIERYPWLRHSPARPSRAAVEPEEPSRQPNLPLTFSDQEEFIRAIRTATSHRRFEALCRPGIMPADALALISAGIGEMVKINRQVLVLVPEVELAQLAAPHLSAALRRSVGVLHGGISPGMRQTVWRSLSNGELDVVVGTRSAVFAPMKNPGLIVVVGESDPSYKAEESPHYHAREVALMRGRIHQIPVLLTAMAPSVETYAKCQDGEHRVLGRSTSSGSLSSFISHLSTSLVDLKTFKPGQLLSEPLMDAIAKRLQVGRSVLLLLNRRGFATALLCRECGHVFRCPRCRVALVLHRKARRLICHSCGVGEDPPTDCPTCKGTRLGGVGAGIEQAEEEIRKVFPKARLLRVDRDTLLSAARTADIYLGTERIFHPPRSLPVSLVGILDADTHLHLPDFHAGERTFQFIVQALASVASSPGGEAMIQTRYPEHWSLSWIKNLDPDAFYRAELSERMQLGYPPFARLATLTVQSANEAKASLSAQNLGQRLMEAAKDQEGIQVLGPSPAPLSLLRGKHRFVILVKASSGRPLQEVIRKALDVDRIRRGRSSVQIGINVDPLHFR
jgi:primosomal protein N' (replication factor Y)